MRLRRAHLPRGMLVGEFLIAVRFVEPRLAKAFPEGGLELHVAGRRLGWAAPVPAGSVTLAATTEPCRAVA